jgi:hypothetical protein
LEAAPDRWIRRRFLRPAPEGRARLETQVLKPSRLTTDSLAGEILAVTSNCAFKAFAVALAVLTVGCAHRDWRRARAEDSASGYHRFLREHPGSGKADEARARLAFVQLRDRPSLEGFEQFARKYGPTGLVEELRPHVEAKFFEQARGIGTAEAYETFLTEFAGGAFEARARGNQEYLSHRGFEGDPVALEAFARQHPESDFAPEALRSVAALRQRRDGALRGVALTVDVDPATPGADRLRRVFTERAVGAFRAVGLDLVPVTGKADPRSKRLGARLHVTHREGEAKARLDQGTVSETGILAETEVTLWEQGVELPIWRDSFAYRAPISARTRDESILFGAGAASYWSRFFVPVATWHNRVTTREPSELPHPAVSVDALEGRAVVSFPDGSFQIWDLADPARPQVLSQYRRPRDLSRFEAAAVVGDRVAVYGQDGLELVKLGGEGPRRERVWGRQEVGSLVSVVDAGKGLALASNRGLLWLAEGATASRTLVPSPIPGLARAGEHLLFTDGATLYSATLAQLASGRFASELRLGRGFGPHRIRVSGTRAVVLGKRAVLCLDVGNPARPVLRSRIEMDEVGAVRDALFASGRIFLLGDRGLQVIDASGERVAESVDVGPRQQLDAAGRQLVLIGERSLQVVDLTALVAAPAAAAPARR